MISSVPKGGYLQKLLRVDLSKKEMSEERVHPELLYHYIGGTGLGVRILWDEERSGIDPFGPENRLILMTGPLTGTLVPGSGTYDEKDASKTFELTKNDRVWIYPFLDGG